MKIEDITPEDIWEYLRVHHKKWLGNKVQQLLKEAWDMTFSKK